MRRGIKCVLACMLIACSVWIGGILFDCHQLNDELIRLHVVANSDSPEDQNIKLLVRDAVTESLKSSLQELSDAEAAKIWLQENLETIQKIADDALLRSGSEHTSVVSLCKEAFETRYYDTFTLPAGVYHALRITIGEGKGENWWCVVFPDLCVPATTDGFEAAATSAGFSDTLNRALVRDDGYEIRFFLLDVMGKVENILFTE